MDNLLNKKYFKYILIFSWVLLLVTFVSKCSFLYRMNDWYDSNCYFTVAYSMKNGGFTLYRDIYEQKGPYLYFIHIMAISIIPNSYVGIYLFELLYGTIFAIFSYKILSLYIESDKRKIIWVILFTTLYYMAPSFASGDSVEESVLPLEMIALYFIIKAYKNKSHIKWYETALIGLFTGFILLSKFIDIGIFAGIMVMVVIYDLIDKKIKDAFLQIPYFLLGFLISLIPAIIYFVSTNAMNDFLTSYFYNNIFFYSGQADSFIKKLAMPLLAYATSIAGCYSVYILIITALIYAIRFKLCKTRLFITMLVSYIFMAILAFAGGGVYIYYGLIFVCFGIFGIIALDRYSYDWKLFEMINRRRIKFLAIYLPICFLLAFIVNEDGWFVFRPRNTYPQLAMSDIINDYNKNHEEKATILTYNTLDYGLYYNTNTLPSTKYFCGLNIPLKEIKEEQNYLLENGLVTYVGTMNETLPEQYMDKYHLKYTDSSWFEFAIHTYYLYELNEASK